VEVVPYVPYGDEAPLVAALLDDESVPAPLQAASAASTAQKAARLRVEVLILWSCLMNVS
jgi:hypothetical protein